MMHSYPVKPLVIIPTYNERENVRNLIPAILDLHSTLSILVVDDSSPDKTADIVFEMQKHGYDGRLFLISQPGKHGLGRAYINGFKWGLAAGHDFLIEMDADWSHPPKYLVTMLHLAKEMDFVVASRYMKGGGTLNWGIGRRLLSRFGSLYSRMVLGMYFSDFTGGFNGWSADVLSQIGLNAFQSNGYGFQIELKYRATKLGFRHIEFPFVFDERRSGKSKMSAVIALEAFWRVWQVRFDSGFKTRDANLANETLKRLIG